MILLQIGYRGLILSSCRRRTSGTADERPRTPYYSYEEALWAKQLEISHASQVLTHESQILVLS